MKYQRLKKFLQTQFIIGRSMIAGIPCDFPDYNVVVVCARNGLYNHDEKYFIRTQDNSAEWRAKRDKLTSEAEYDIIRIR